MRPIAYMLLFVAACQAASFEPWRAALRTQHSPREPLEIAAQELLHGQPVSLGGNAFVATSLVALTHQPRRQIHEQHAAGLVLAQPVQIKLVKNQTACGLQLVTTNEVKPLPNYTCQYEHAR